MSLEHESRIPQDVQSQRDQDKGKRQMPVLADTSAKDRARRRPPRRRSPSPFVVANTTMPTPSIDATPNGPNSLDGPTRLALTVFDFSPDRDDEHWRFDYYFDVATQRLIAAGSQ